MKHLLSVMLVVATVVTAFATAQLTERINDNGVSKSLAGYLLELDSISFSKLEQRIPDEMVSTGLWRGYIGHWKIKNDSLFLDSVLVRDTACDTLRFVPAKIDDIYASHPAPSGYFADWITDTLRVVSGKILHYDHMGWASDWETEEFVSVEGGLVKDRVVYKNRLVNTVPKGESRLRKVLDSLDLGFIPQKIFLRLGYEGFNDDGTPTGYKVKIMRSSGDTIVDIRVARAFSDPTVMHTLIPIYYIRGHYKSPDCTIPIPVSHDHHEVSN